MMPLMSLSHFEATILFALFISVMLGITGRKTDRGRFHYGAKCFGYFIAALFGISWLMYLGHG
jgi:hypothetical protein